MGGGEAVAEGGDGMDQAEEDLGGVSKVCVNWGRAVAVTDFFLV